MNRLAGMIWCDTMGKIAGNGDHRRPSTTEVVLGEIEEALVGVGYASGRAD